MLARNSVIRVMALGDSITAGVGAYGSHIDDGGYRGALAKLLAKNGYRVKFVGSRNDYSAAIDDRAHEGWPGYVLRSFPSDPGPGQLYGALVRKAIRRYEPDLILLMAGTNDLLRLEKRADGYTLANIAHSMDLLLGEVFRQKPHVRVIVAPVVASPLVDICTLAHFDGGEDSACGPSETENLATLVRDYARRGYPDLAGSLDGRRRSARPRPLSGRHSSLRRGRLLSGSQRLVRGDLRRDRKFRDRIVKRRGPEQALTYHWLSAWSLFIPPPVGNKTICVVKHNPASVSTCSTVFVELPLRSWSGTTRGWSVD